MTLLAMCLSCIACGDAFSTEGGGGGAGTSCSAATGDTCWFSEEFDTRRTLLIDHALVSEKHQHFPVFVQILEAPDLFERTSDNADNLVFTSADGTRLPHEIEKWCKTIGPGCSAPELGIWVAADLAADADTRLYLYYGGPAQAEASDPSEVWDAGYAAVYHLSSAHQGKSAGGCAAGNFGCDATRNANHATEEGELAGGHGIAGKIGQAVNFTSHKGWLEAAHSESLNITGNAITLIAWVRMSSVQEYDPGVMGKSTGAGTEYELVQGDATDDTSIRNSDFRIHTVGSGSYRRVYGAIPLQKGVWHYLAGSYDGSMLKAFTDGQLGESVAVSGSLAGSDEPLVIGRSPLGDDRYFDGAIDEVRISNVARSDGWLMTSYQNQSAPQTFAKLGEPEPRP